jgi:hypothetical protein
LQAILQHLLYGVQNQDQMQYFSLWN